MPAPATIDAFVDLVSKSGLLTEADLPGYLESLRAGGAVLTVFMTLLYAIIVPLLTVAGVLMLIVIGMLIGMNLMLLAVWLSVIHWIFVLLNGK